MPWEQALNDVAVPCGGVLAAIYDQDADERSVLVRSCTVLCEITHVVF